MKLITARFIAIGLVFGATLSSEVMAEDCSVSFYCYGNSPLPAINTRVVATTTPRVTSVRVNPQPAPTANQQQSIRQRAQQQAAQQAVARQRALQAQRIAIARQRAQQQARVVAQRRAAQANWNNRPAILDARRSVVATANPAPIRPVSNNAPTATRRPVVENCSQLTSNLTQQAERTERLALLQSKNGQRDRARVLFSQVEQIRQRLKNINCQVM